MPDTFANCHISIILHCNTLCNVVFYHLSFTFIVTIIVFTFLTFYYKILTYRVLRSIMISEEKLEKVCKDFSKLEEEQQNYIFGIMQALLFAKSTGSNEEPGKSSKEQKN